MSKLFLIAFLAVIGLGVGIVLSCSSGGDDDSSSGDDDTLASYCSDGCQKVSDCGLFGPDSMFGTDLSSCISGCETYTNASVEACDNNCDYSAGCDTWSSCIANCAGAITDDDTAG